jgi:hypothetical protein
VVPCFENMLSVKSHHPEYWYDEFYHSVPNDFDLYSTFIDIASIHNSWINNDDESKICYTFTDTNAYFFSEPKKINKINPKSVQEHGVSYESNIRLRIECTTFFKPI